MAAIKLQQALFGYDGGHQLISASVSLPTDAKHEMSVATDLSGTPPPEGFDKSFTGMPLVGTQFYALFCTWLAPEMPRPGCVWSHALLIELADMAQIPDLGELRSLFRRPRKWGFQKWNEPIQFTIGRSATGAISHLPESTCSYFFQKLYATASTPAFVPAVTSDGWEELIFALWSQQWPKLRRSFRFSTGSFADRGRSRVPFDLQIVPESNSRSVWNEPPPRTQTEAHLQTDSTWINAAYLDLRTPDETGFRSFLQTYGADINFPRTAFARLATAFVEIEKSKTNSWMQQFTTVADLFPDKAEAIRLKEIILGPQNRRSAKDRLDHAKDAMQFLFGNSKRDAYSRANVDYSAFAAILWRADRAVTIGLLMELFRSQESSAAKAFVSGISENVEVFDFKSLAQEIPELIPIIIGNRVSLAFEPETWRLPSYIQSHIFEVLDHSSLSQTDWASVLGAMFIAATFVSVRQVIEKAGSLAMSGALRWLDYPEAEQYLPSEGWREALARAAEEELQSTDELKPSAFSLCAWCLSTEAARRILTSSRRDIQLFGTEPLDQVPLPLRTATAFLLMTVGLRSLDESGAPLIMRSFFPVHRALALRDYEAAAWSLLSPELPYLGRWQDWDRCKKLRRAVGAWLRDHPIVVDAFLKNVGTDEERSIAAEVLDSAAN